MREACPEAALDNVLQAPFVVKRSTGRPVKRESKWKNRRVQAVSGMVNETSLVVGYSRRRALRDAASWTAVSRAQVVCEQEGLKVARRKQEDGLVMLIDVIFYSTGLKKVI